MAAGALDAHWKGIASCDYIDFCRLGATNYVVSLWIFVFFCWYCGGTLLWRGSCFACTISRTPLADSCQPIGFYGHVPTVSGQSLARENLTNYWLYSTAPTAFRQLLVHRTLERFWLERCTPAVCICILSSTRYTSLLHIALFCMLVRSFPICFLFGADACAFAFVVLFRFRLLVCAL